MDEAAFEALLRAWGRVLGERPDFGEGDADSSHPLARAMQFAPGKRSLVIRQRTTMDRAGTSRRRLMAEAANAGLPPGAIGFRTLPAHFVDPVAGKETRRAVYGDGETSRPIPPELLRVERAAIKLLSLHPLPGLCVRFEYCSLGPQVEKAEVVSLRFGEPVKLRRYREALGYGKGWMAGALVLAEHA